MKKLLCLIFLAAVVLMFAGCSAQTAQPTSTESAVDSIGTDISDIDAIDSDLDTSELDNMDQELDNISW